MTKSGIKISSLGVLYAVCVAYVCRAFHSHFALAKCAWFYYFVHIVYLWSILWVTVTCLRACTQCAVKCTSRAIRVSHCIWYRLANIFWLDGVLLLRFCQINNMKILCKTHTHTQAQRIFIRMFVCIQAITNMHRHTHHASKQCKIEMIATEWWMVWPPKKERWQKIAWAQFEAK